VEKEFTAHLTKAEELASAPLSTESDLTVLAKAEEKSLPPKKEEKPEEEKPKANPAENQAAPAHGSEAPAEAKPEAPAQPQAEAKPEDMKAPQGHDYDAEDLEHMRQMYASMSQEELKAHHDCIASLAKCGSETAPTKGMSKGELKDENPTLNSKPHDKGSDLFPDKQNGGIEGSAPHNALGPKSAASDANGAKINKSEHDRRNGGKQEEQAPGKTPGAKSADSDANGAQMNKSEVGPEIELLKSELTAEKAKFDLLKKQFDGVAEFLTKLVEKKAAPAAKAITSLDVIAKSEDSGEDKVLSKGEVNSILSKKSSDPTLKKADRDLINAYYLNDASINSISHLLK
jgi:hypothetical protein